MSTSVTNVISHFPSAENGFTTTTSGAVSSGATTVGLNSVAGYANGETVVFVIDPDDTTKKQTFTGVIDTAGVQVTNVIWTAGTNQGHSAGATVVDYATATHISMITKGILVHADQDGSLKAGAVDEAAVLASNVVTTTKILDSNVTTGKLANASVTADKLNTGADTASIATSEASASTTFVDLATAGPSVTVTIGANGKALVSWGAQIQNSTGDARNSIGVFMSGANTESPAVGDLHTLTHAFTGTATSTTGDRTMLYEGLTAGITTFTLKYARTGGTDAFSNRHISVVPL